MKKPMKCIGDADTLMKLKFYKLERELLVSCVPDADKYLSLLNEKQIDEIIA